MRHSKEIYDIFSAKYSYDASTGIFRYKATDKIAGSIKRHYVILSKTIDGKQYHMQAHRLAWYISKGVIPDTINHKITGNEGKSDNRLSNLEDVTPRENGNKKHLLSSSEYTGVYWNKQRSRWHARIHVEGKQRHIGLFDSEIEAHKAYQEELKGINHAINSNS